MERVNFQLIEKNGNQFGIKRKSTEKIVVKNSTV